LNSELSSYRPEHWISAAWRLILRLVLAAGLVYVLYRLRVVIVVVLISVMLALAVTPLVDRLQRSTLLRIVPRHIRRSVAAGTVFLLLAAFLIQVCILVVGPLATEIQTFASNWNTHLETLQERVAWLKGQIATLPPDIRTWLEEQNFSGMGDGLAHQLQHVLRHTLESGMFLVELILIPVLAFSFLTESRPLKKEFAHILPPGWLRDGLYLMRRVGMILQSYAVGQLILALIAGVVVWVLMVTLGVRYALALAMIAAVTRVIPVIGPLLGGIPIVLLATLQSWDRGFIVLVLFTLLHLVESKVVMPRLIGHRIELHPAIVIIVLLIGAEFFGMWGMFLAAPAAAIVKVLFHYFFVRPRRRGGSPPPPQSPVAVKGIDVERPAVAGVGTHSRAH